MIITVKQILHLMAIARSYNDILSQCNMKEDLQDDIAHLLKKIHDQQSEELSLVQ